MSGIELLRQGIEETDWSLIREGFKTMFGQDVQHKAAALPPPHLLDQVRERLTAALTLLGASSPAPEPSPTDAAPHPAVPQGPVDASRFCIRRGDIDGEPPEESIREAQTGQATPYGTEVTVISQETVYTGEREVNRARAGRAAPRKAALPARTPLKKAPCTSCGKDVLVTIAAPKEIGIQCSDCIGKKRGSRGNDDE